MFKNKFGEICILEQPSNSDASDLSEKQMLARTYILKEEVQVPGLGCKGPTDSDAGYKCRQRFHSSALLIR